MTVSGNLHDRLCSTCAFWAGIRKLRPGGNSPLLRGPMSGRWLPIRLDGGPGYLPEMAIIARRRAGYGLGNGY